MHDILRSAKAYDTSPVGGRTAKSDSLKKPQGVCAKPEASLLH